MPIFGLGTYQSQSNEVGEACMSAYKFGYIHIDTATFYENEKVIGLAMKEMKRDEIFLVTKLWNSDHHKVEKALEESLAKL